MKFTLAALGTACTSLLSGAAATPLAARNNDSVCISPRPLPDLTGADIRRVGVVLFQALDMIDVFGPLDPLQIMAKSTQQMQLHMIAETLEPVTTAPASMNPHNSSFYPTIPVTDTFDDDLDLDVLIVPGGPGVRAPNLEPVEQYVARMFPKVKFLLNICTGSGLAARSGVMDGYLSTTNKAAFDDITSWGPDVHWVSPARYVVDGKIWSSSGVSPSIPREFRFIP